MLFYLFAPSFPRLLIQIVSMYLFTLNLVISTHSLTHAKVALSVTLSTIFLEIFQCMIYLSLLPFSMLSCYQDLLPPAKNRFLHINPIGPLNILVPPELSSLFQSGKISSVPSAVDSNPVHF